MTEIGEQVRLQELSFGWNKFSIACCWAMQAVLTVYLGLYAFRNPDQPAWVGETDEEKLALFESRASAKEQVKMYRVTNVHAHFEAWFVFGFLVNLSPALIFTIYKTAALCSFEIAKFLAITLAFLAGLAWTTWYILGIVWRFSRAGRYASWGSDGFGYSVELEIISTDDNMLSQD